MPKWVETTTRVRWHEVDAQGIVYYGNYFHYCDLGREALALAADLDYSSVDILTVEFNLKFRGSARYMDELVIRTQVDWPKAARFKFHYEIYRKLGRELLVHGQSTHMMVTDHGLRMSMDPYLHQKFTAFLDRDS